MANPVAEQCACAKGADGRCAACLAMIGALTKELAGLIMESQRRIDERIAKAGQVCGPCARRDWDAALAATVRVLAADKSGDQKQKVGSIVGAAIKLVEAGKQQGVQAYPLTEKALTEMATAAAGLA
jgi:hypothetical protein